MYYVIKKSLKIASRNVLEIRFVASMAARVEVERSGTVHYLEQDLGTVLILSCVRNKSARRRSWKERKKKKKKWKEVHAMSCWVGKDARESFLGKSSHVPALSDAANLLERSSLEKSYFLRHAAFPSLLLRSFQRSLLLLPIREIWLFDHSHISSRYDFDETIHRYFVNFTFHLFSWFISRIMKLHKVYSEVYIGVKDEFSKMD